jgi:hypothetical protein
VVEVNLPEIQELVEAGLRGELTFHELYAAWPEAPDDPYLRTVRDDLEFAVEHISGRRSGPRRFGVGWRTGPLVADLDVWPTRPEYEDLMDHLNRLRRMRREGLQQ